MDSAAEVAGFVEPPQSSLLHVPPFTAAGMQAFSLLAGDLVRSWRLSGHVLRMDGWMDGWIDGWLDGWMDGWTDGWLDGRMDGWLDGWML